MKNILILSGILVVAFFIFWGYILKSGGDVLEYDHPSNSIEHAKEKHVFISQVLFIHPDSIAITDKIIFPNQAWLEKKTRWKSEELKMDSLSFDRDSVTLVLTFKAYKEHRPFISSMEYAQGNLTNEHTHQTSPLYNRGNTNILKTDFTIPYSSINDTLKIRTEDDNYELMMIIKNN